jgi:hypothetical protein
MSQLIKLKTKSLRLRWLWSEKTVIAMLLIASVVVNVLLANKSRRLEHRLAVWESGKKLMPGTIVPPLEVMSLEGTSTKIDYLNTTKPTVLYVLSASCDWCELNAGNIDGLVSKLGNDYRFIGIILDRDPNEVRDYVSKKNPLSPFTIRELESRPIEVENLVNAANAAPPEFGADALIRIVASGRVTSQTWKKEILEKAFFLAANSQQPFRRTSIYFPHSSTDTLQGFLSAAYTFKLDALSLRVRIIKAMLPLDKERARQLFESISPKLPLPPCHATTHLHMISPSTTSRSLHLRTARSAIKKSKKAPRLVLSRST